MKKAASLRIVLKFGTGVLARPGGSALDTAQFRRIAEEVAALMKAGHECLIVSSAAIAAGVKMLGFTERPADLPGKQACAAAGQPELMRLYSASFQRHGVRPAQLLLTHGDIDSRVRRKNARNTLDRLLSVPGVVPIINENDSVAVEEVRFGDNDRLSAEVAQLVRANLLIILTSSDGVQDNHGKRIPVINDIGAAFSYVRPDKGTLSVGGMKTKLEAVQLAHNVNIPAVIIDGRVPGLIAKAVKGKDAGTRFPV
jgi:glutamate 5-kinase